MNEHVHAMTASQIVYL